LARLFKKSYLKNEKELGRSENGFWRLVVAIYAPGSSIFFSLAILNGKSSLVLMSGPKRNPPYAELSRSSNGFFKPLLDPGGGFRRKTAVKKPNARK
jgi:hypothetical protein